MSSSQDARDRSSCSLVQRDPVKSELDDVDTEAPLCKPFSIREYVFSTRGKHLSKNWPFHQRCIQVCRKHGVEDLLPPFESPALVREREDKYFEPHDAANVGTSPQLRTDSDAVDDQHALLTEDMDGVIAGISRKLGLLYVTCRDEIKGDKVMEEYALRVDKMAGDYKLEAITSSRYSAEAELWFASLDFASEDPKHLLRSEDDLLVGANDVVGNVRISVTENLTLENVSKSGVTDVIDDAAEASQGLIQKRHKSQRCKVKSRKKRSMVDICAKALPCTLEDLDKKNGTNWALDPSVRPYGIPDSDKVKKYLVERDGRNKPSKLPRPNILININPESTNCKNSSISGDDPSQGKQLGGNNTNRYSVASSKRRCLQMSVLRDCSHSSAMKLSSQRTKEDKGASACGYQNEIMRLRVEELSGGQDQHHELCRPEMLSPIKRCLQKGCATHQQTSPSNVESRQKSQIVHAVKTRLLTTTTNTSSLENFAVRVAQYQRKPRTVKRMRKVDSITSCVAAVKQTRDRSESELFRSELTEFCHSSPRASIHSSNSYTEEGTDAVKLKEKDNLFPFTSIFENGGNSSTEPTMDELAMTCSPNSTLYEAFQPYLHSEESELCHASYYHCTHDIHGGEGKPYGLQEAFFDEICKNRMTGGQLLVEDNTKDCQGIIQKDQCELKPKDSVSSVVTTSSSNCLNGSVRLDNQPAPSLPFKWLEVNGKCCTC